MKVIVGQRFTMSYNLQGKMSKSQLKLIFLMVEVLTVHLKFQYLLIILP